MEGEDLRLDVGVLSLVGVGGALMVQGVVDVALMRVQGVVGVALMRVQVVVEIHCQNEDWQKI